MERIIQQVIQGSKEAEATLFQNFHERFLHLVQQILWIEKVTKEVAKNALESFKKQYQEFIQKTNFIEWTQELVDEEIDRFFIGLIKKIKEDSDIMKERSLKDKEIQFRLDQNTELFMQVLNRRFMFIGKKKINMDRQVLDINDLKEIIQRTLLVILNKFKTEKFKGKFIQWAQMVFYNKYREYRKKKYREWLRVRSISQEDYEREYKERLNYRSRIKKEEFELTQNMAEMYNKVIREYEKEESYIDDPFTVDPESLVIGKEVRKIIKSLLMKSQDKCKRVFEALLSGCDIHDVYKIYPEISYVKAHRCREQLKKELMEWGIRK